MSEMAGIGGNWSTKRRSTENPTPQPLIEMIKASTNASSDETPSAEQL